MTKPERVTAVGSTALFDDLDDALSTLEGHIKGDPGMEITRLRGMLQAAKPRMASELSHRLWEISRLRHAMFMPSEFRGICESVIMEYLSNVPASATPGAGHPRLLRSRSAGRSGVGWTRWFGFWCFEIDAKRAK
jgi:hypothetical protein